MTTAIETVLAEGQTLLNAGNIQAALAQFFRALKTSPDDVTSRHMLIHTLNMLDGYKIPQKYMPALMSAVTDTRIDPTPLPRIARNVLFQDARLPTLQQSPTAGDHVWFYSSPLLINALERATVADEQLEHILVLIRGAILNDAVAGSTDILRTQPAFVTALAVQCVMTRHIWSITETEQTQLASIAIRAPLTASDIALIRSMYQPLELIDVTELPRALQDIVRLREQESQFAAALPHLTPITAGVSSKVREQYETYPYPLWRDVALNTPKSWTDVVARYAGPTPETFPQPDLLDVLVAGCGTGRSTALIAKMLPTARIVAVDLSRKSLGYAARQALSHGLTNVTFGVADILRISELGRLFHFIDCGGVLHHMADPAAGLQALTKILVPGGLMNVALYSERARASVTAARIFIAGQGYDGSLDGMRMARQAILALPVDHPARRVTRWIDFSSADGMHDLLFNVQETTFTPVRLKTMLQATGLTFLGFNVAKPKHAVAFRTMFPDDKLGRDLDNWETFEQQHTDTFMGMMSFWLQKPL